MSASDLDRARAGENLAVNSSSIEKSLAELWRGEQDGENAVTRAALWNVVAHTTNPRDHSHASEILARASEAVPQRAIVIRAEIDAASEISSWISANCHRVGGEKQVCSEEVAIVAGGNRVRHIPPLVSSLLIPDMPVAVWWVGDLPNEDHSYVELLLDPAERLIIDSSHFDSVGDLQWLRQIAGRTFTAPADLNWVKLEDWRLVTASLFDSPSMRERLPEIRKVSVTAQGGATSLFGDSIESLYYAAWLTVQTGSSDIECSFCVNPGEDAGAVVDVKIEFADGQQAQIARDSSRAVLLATVDGKTQTFDCVTRMLGRGPHELIVRQLKRPETDQVFVKLLPIAIDLAARITR